MVDTNRTVSGYGNSQKCCVYEEIELEEMLVRICQSIYEFANLNLIYDEIGDKNPFGTLTFFLGLSYIWNSFVLYRSSGNFLRSLYSFKLLTDRTAVSSLVLMVISYIFIYTLNGRSGLPVFFIFTYCSVGSWLITLFRENGPD